MKYYCKRCKTEITGIGHPIVVCQNCLLVQLVPYRYRPQYETHVKKYETRERKNG